MTDTVPEIVITPDRGPQLVYASYDPKENLAHLVPVDRIAVEDPRERALCRALLLHALALLDASEPTIPNGRAQ
ncbi:hypothetical protein ACFXGT_08205 [Streptomyces sp. NPDC059352]|uniref:hypothetical protein n=1 Tax=Streptomyces sp. NPDC059352 TaxID=3346810 RepID=UPI0036A0A024